MSVRGYVRYEPKGDRAYWLRATQSVLVDYKDEWPLTVRQIFYRLVEEHDYTKTEPAYNSLVTLIAKARRSHLVAQNGVPFKAIRDGGLSQSKKPRPPEFEDETHFLDTIRDAAENFRLVRQAGQLQVIELWCEAGGMVPILQRVGNVYGTRVSSGGGYDSLTLRHDLATRVVERAEQGLRTVICHVGDFDPSGENMCEVLAEDVGTMVYQRTEEDYDEWFEVKRIALTEDQVIERAVTASPPKPSDSRTTGFIRAHPRAVAHFGSVNITAQLEALTPPELRALLTEAVEAEIDREVYDAVLADEAEIRERLMERFE